ncbi:MAG: malonyl-CoA decarboxylase family protein [Pseudomonadota bacterium]
MSTFRNLVQAVTDGVTPPRWRHIPSQSLAELAGSIIAAEGFDQVRSFASAFWEAYQVADQTARIEMFEYLSSELDLDIPLIRAKLDVLEHDMSSKALQEFASVSEAPRRELFRRLNQARNGTHSLVRMRQDLRSLLKDNPDLSRVDSDLKFLLRAWFNLGVLELRPLNWSSPANVLEKLIKYEAVHQIDSWAALRQRTEPADRRCFGYFHPAMPDEPIIFVQVALGPEVPNAIAGILTHDREVCPPEDAKVATFYSISNCQDGLAGISFGNFLIKQVVKFLQLEFEGLETFVTLSPIPGLSNWASDVFASDSFASDPLAVQQAAAYFLTEIKGRGQEPADPVARFHLSNGARIHAVHADADLSEKGVSQSYGAMVNYLYELPEISKNHHDFATDGRIVRSKPVTQLASAAAQKISQIAAE